MTVHIFALTNRGLEPIAAGEMGDFPGLKVTGLSYRRISATYEGELSNLMTLRTVDDVFIDLATWEDIGPQRSSLETLKKQGEQLTLDTAVRLISGIRPIHTPASFSITANFVGKRNYTSDEIKQAVAEGFTRRYEGHYTAENASEVNLRIFIEHQRAYVGVRLSKTALHRRQYKQIHIPGSLKPSVAAAMLYIADLEPDQLLLDPFCGAGTILIEAAWQGSPAIGGDHQVEAMQAAKTNAGFAGMQLCIALWDAQKLPLASHSIERIVTNLPWGHQVTVDESMASFYGNICQELERVLKYEGQIVLLTNLPHLVHFEGLEKKTETEISLFGMNPSIMQFSSL